jgi:hypothetical protein
VIGFSLTAEGITRQTETNKIKEYRRKEIVARMEEKK